MNSEIKKLWCEKLRSGEYEQGKGSLRPDGNAELGGYSFCCLGVLCDLALAVPKLKGAWEKDYFLVDGLAPVQMAGLLPIAIAEWAGLYRGTEERNPQCTLARLNDDGATFSRIADYIEANL